MDIKNLFSLELSNKIMKITYFAISIAIFSFIIDTTEYQLGIDNLPRVVQSDAFSFILPATIIFLFAMIYKKGVEKGQSHQIIYARSYLQSPRLPTRRCF